MSEILTHGAPVGTHVERMARLGQLGFTADIAQRVIDYVDRLNELQLQKATEQYPHLFGAQFDVAPEDRQRERLAEYFDVDPGATKGNKYVRIVDMAPSHRDGTIKPTSVHSIVVKADGRVCKAAGWKGGPVKSTAAATKGQIMSRYTLTDDESFQRLLAELDTHGSYLYQR